MMQPIDVAQVEEGDTVLDVRRHVGREQIRGALRYDPNKLLGAPHVVLPLNLEGRIVLVADSEEDAEAVAERLTAMGSRDVRFLRYGVAGWRDSGRPTEEPAQEQPIPESLKAGLPLV